MLEKEHKKADEDCQQKREAIRNTPYQVKADRLIALGWKSHKHTLEHNGEKFDLEMWGNKEKDILGETMENAIVREDYIEAKKKKEEEYREYKAECHCNKCGKDLLIFDEDMPMGYYGLIDAKVHGGYLSEELSDLCTYKFSLCESCIAELFASFLKPPEIDTYI